MEHIKTFDFEKTLPENFFGIIYGIRRSGKSTVLKKILYDMRHRLKDHMVYLFSSTAKVDPEQYEYYPKGFKYSELDNLEDELGEIIEDQGDKLDVPKEKREKALKDNKILVILDDCVNEDSIRKSPSLNNLAVSGRHINFSVFILSQSVTGSASVPPIIRTNSDFIILATLPRSVKERDLLTEQYLLGSHHCNRQTAYRILEKITSVKYRVVIITMFETAARVYQEYVFSYGPFEKDAVPKDFKIGTAKQWQKSPDEDSESDNDGAKGLTHIESVKVCSDPMENKNDVHGGSTSYNDGSQKAADSKEDRMKKYLALRKRNFMTMMPPALSNENNELVLRNFCDFSVMGSSGVVDASKTFDVNNMPMTVNYAAPAGFQKRSRVPHKGNKIVIRQELEDKWRGSAPSQNKRKRRRK